MTKAALVTALADKMGSDKKSAAAALDALSDIITSEVSSGGAVTIPNVGKIVLPRSRPSAWCATPPPANRSRKPADKVVKMTIAKALKDSVNG